MRLLFWAGERLVIGEHMTIALLATYLAMDRRHRLIEESTLPDRMTGSALLADISGFTKYPGNCIERRNIEQESRDTPYHKY